MPIDARYGWSLRTPLAASSSADTFMPSRSAAVFGFSRNSRIRPLPSTVTGPRLEKPEAASALVSVRTWRLRVPFSSLT